MVYYYIIFTIELYPKQVVAEFLRFCGTATDEFREISLPIRPVDLPPAIIVDGFVPFVVDVMRKCSLMAFIFEAAQRFERYSTVGFLTEISR